MLDILVDRTSVLTVDVGLKMHAILSATLEYHHHQASAWTPPENRSNDPQLASQAVAQQVLYFFRSEKTDSEKTDQAHHGWPQLL